MLELGLVRGHDLRHRRITPCIIRMNEGQHVRGLMHDLAVRGSPLPLYGPDREPLGKAHGDYRAEESIPLLGRDDTLPHSGSEIEGVTCIYLLPRSAQMSPCRHAPLQKEETNTQTAHHSHVS